MINLLRNKIAQYVKRNSNMNSWKSIRESYGAYTYLSFLCLSVNTLESVSSINDVIRIALSNALETKELLDTIFQYKSASPFVKEVIELLQYWKKYDIEQLYQDFLSIDFYVKNGEFIFENGKNCRDILGSYYTQEEFAEAITNKAIDDYLAQNKKTEKLVIADYSCGGSIFLCAALKKCIEKRIPVDIYGYDVDPVAVLVSRTKILLINSNNTSRVRIILGNPLLPPRSNCGEKFKMALSGRFYNMNMGVKSICNLDIILGNPPWEKVRFEEKKFLKHFFSDSELGTRTDRENVLRGVSKTNSLYFESLINDYDCCKCLFRNSKEFKYSACGEINTYALFTELSYNKLKPAGIASLIVKSSLVKLPVYKSFFGELTKNGELYELYMFSNRKKIFNIDSREEFSVIYLSKKITRPLRVALNLEDYSQMPSCTKVVLSYSDLFLLNPETGMIPSIKNESDLVFLLNLSKQFLPFGKIYKDCRFGRLVHLTNHSNYIQKSIADNFLPIYEGKFIELYTGKYATFRDMNEENKYKNKASATTIDNPQGSEYPESRFFIHQTAWNSLSKNFENNYVIAWRSLTSATNRRTMLATILPLIPTCQSIQLLQLNDSQQMLHILALFDSIIFDYIVRLKMVGLDLTQTIIKQIPVPRNEQYEEIIDFNGITSSISTHIISRLYFLYKDDYRIRAVFSKFNIYEIDKDRKKVISEIDCLIGHLYQLSREEIVRIATSFTSFYTNEEVAAYFQ